MSTNPCDRMEAAWDPARREQARQALAQSIDKYTRPTQPAWAGNTSTQRRPRT